MPHFQCGCVSRRSNIHDFCIKKSCSLANDNNPMRPNLAIRHAACYRFPRTFGRRRARRPAKALEPDLGTDFGYTVRLRSKRERSVSLVLRLLPCHDSP
jgi:hypothetical protein